MSPTQYDILDERFLQLILQHAPLNQHDKSAIWAEGPAYFPAHRSLIYSDIPNDRLLRFDEATGKTHVIRQHTGHFTNGNTIDNVGRLVSCEHGTRSVTRTEHDGSVTVLADRYQSKRLNSPNDVVVKSDGSIWFTDPRYGIDSDREGYKAESELDACYVFRIDAQTGNVRIVADDFVRPNGLAFSPDERQLYIADSGVKPGLLRVFDVEAGCTLSHGKLFATCTDGLFDGFRLDEAGRIWTSAFDGVHCYEPDGTHLGKIAIPEKVANVVFGGLARNHLYICATTSLYSITLAVKGLKTF